MRAKEQDQNLKARKLPWTQPQLKKISAGSAENGIENDIPDAQFSKS